MPGGKNDIMEISRSGMLAQEQRMKIIAQNIANAGTTPSAPGQLPYQRQIITFKNEFDKALGAYRVKVTGVRNDTAEFGKKYDPTNPAADTQGYIQTPNVNTLAEQMDMNDATRSYQANVDVITAAKTMAQKTVSLLQ